MGTIESIALMPVAIGSPTGCRSAMPGATMSMRRVVVDAIAGPPSIATPSGFTTRPMSSSPTGTSRRRPVLLTWSPSLISR